MPSDQFRRKAQFPPHRPNLILEQLAERLNQTEVHLCGEASDIVVRLDRVGGPAEGSGLDDVGVERALAQKADISDRARLLLEDLDKRLSDDLPFLFGVGDSLQLPEKSLCRVHVVETEMVAVTVDLQDQLALSRPHEAVVDMNAIEPVTDRPVKQDGKDGGIDPSAQRANHVAIPRRRPDIPD